MAKHNFPSCVYQYTSAQGLLGLAESYTLRATEASGLNDREELTYGWNILPGLIHKAGQGDLAKALESAQSNNNDRDVFVACASSLSDDAGQWERYANGGCGYAIGLDTAPKWVVKVNRAHPGQREDFFNFWRVSPWQRVLYTEEEIERELTTWIPATLSQYLADGVKIRSAKNGDEDSEFQFDQIVNLLTATDSMIHRLKREGFQGEREYRLTAVTSDLEAINYRESKYGIVRYVDLVIPTEQQVDGRLHYDKEKSKESQTFPPPIQQVKIGPAYDPEGASTLSHFMGRSGFRCTVNASAVALR